MSKKKTSFPTEFSALIGEFERKKVEYLVVGGYAVGAHGRPRATKDLDLWIAGGENLERVASALSSFGLPSALVETARALGENEVLYFGTPPLRVDLLRSIAGIDFRAALGRAMRIPLGDVAEVSVIGLDDLITNKAAAARPQDLADVRALSRIRSRDPKREP
jgi:hypothetical protein